ncbi:hypothetical protein TIFTF001_048119 [Ficus carica]|uniref:Uncharacterized protein n=1 Tax=Ficus carica TaxID=3494 RepID=A0AA87ZH34_FICCA|nr:hypothetical protein TIFTF001_048112 [Ficus carica]GMN31706.1 hypothetical protein TIFTF001_048115 [Ficus carica]GMN31713.1 hypothetical protein TIFTF001_048116 [Ficus carica]GMN31731.1 hypothetical protein TIFTF001_048119 [Ficus carica]
MAQVVSAEPAGLAAGIAAAEASFAAVLAADAKHLLSEPAPICLSGYDTLVRNRVLPHQRHFEWKKLSDHLIRFLKVYRTILDFELPFFSRIQITQFEHNRSF